MKNHMWRDWQTEPPQLPDAPIEVRLSDAPSTAMTATVNELRKLCAISDMIQWRPLGIYREEFYETMRRWE